MHFICWKFVLIICFLLILSFYNTAAQIDGIYCGKMNCYDVLKVSRNSDKSTIRKAYHSLARKHHPDKQKNAEDKANSDDYFILINAAYEILGDSERKKEYDYMLDNPDQMYYNYYQYYRRQYGPNVDVRLVILSIILIISTIQYVGQQTSYNHAVSFLLKDPKHRARAKQLMSSDGRYNLSKREADGRRLTRDELKEREEQILRDLIKDTVELKGDCGKPSIKRVLFTQIIIFPWTCSKWIYWCLRWVTLYWILRKPYDEDAQIFITRRQMNLSAAAWEGLDESSRIKYLSKKLWIKENHELYLAAEAEKVRILAAENTNQKRFRRYIKKTGGPPQANMDELEM